MQSFSSDDRAAAADDHAGDAPAPHGSFAPSHVAELPSGAGQTRREVIEQTVAQVFGVARRDLDRPTRGRAPVARARQVAMYLAHVACGMSLTDVGRIFSRDRTTVAHACGVVEDGRDDLVFDRVLELLEQIVTARLAAYREGWGCNRGWLLQ